MTTKIEELGTPYRSSTKPLIGGISFDWMMIGACSLLMTGGFLDAWAHNHFTLETFFTPWHGVLYAGFLVVAVVLLGTIVLNHAKGETWQKAVPAGYELSVLGVCGFAIGGVADMFWHLLFGIEKNTPHDLLGIHLSGAVSRGVETFKRTYEAKMVDTTHAPRFSAALAFGLLPHHPDSEPIHLSRAHDCIGGTRA